MRKDVSLTSPPWADADLGVGSPRSCWRHTRLRKQRRAGRGARGGLERSGPGLGSGLVCSLEHISALAEARVAAKELTGYGLWRAEGGQGEGGG